MNATPLKTCFRNPIPEIFDAARYLDAAVSAHIVGKKDIARELIRMADMQEIWDWTDSIWGKKSPYVKHHAIQDAPPLIPKEQRIQKRMPTKDEREALHRRDGFHCRFCGIPLIRKEIRQRLHKLYPDAAKWGNRNIDCHASFQAMWLQYDHLVPHSRGGNNDLDNLILTCAPCNFGRMESTIEEVGLEDPRTREKVQSSWDGLERLLISS